MISIICHRGFFLKPKGAGYKHFKNVKLVLSISYVYT